MDAREPFAEQAEVTCKVNYFGTLDVCNALFPLLRNNARVINVSSSAGHLSRIPSRELQKQFSDPNLTQDELNELIKKFIRYVIIEQKIFYCQKSLMYFYY